MRSFLSILAFSALTACNQSQQPSKPGAADTAFQFSTAAAVTNTADERNVCQKHFTDAALINADTANTNRRYFLLNDGIYRVAAQLGNMTSSFLLQKSGDKSAELFTSDNFPLCLSKREYFSMADGGPFFTYNNLKGIAYTVEAQSSAEGLFIILVFPPDMRYGLNVHRCADCR